MVTQTDLLQVLATGFSLTHWDVDVRGRAGRSRAQHWDDFGYIEAFHSVAMNEFPNFFYILGPNCGRAHTSTLFAIERSLSIHIRTPHGNRTDWTSYTHLILRVIRPILEGRASAVEPKHDSERRYNEQLHAAIDKTVFTDSCGTVRFPLVSPVLSPR